MHVVFVSLSVPIILLGCIGILIALQRWPDIDWQQRRNLHMLTLMAPLIALGIGLSGLHDFLVRVCGLSEQLWYTLVVAALGLMTLIAVGGIAIGFTRLMLLLRVMSRSANPASAALQTRVDTLAKQLDIGYIQVMLCADNKPLALTWGVRYRKLLLSTWMLHNLDQPELQSVLAHELAHVKRRDFLFAWVTTLLRDAFFYLPASRVAHKLVRKDNELACDDLAAHVTGDPLALASALVKVWRHALDVPPHSYAQALLGMRGAHDLEIRIERLIALSDGIATQPTRHHSFQTLHIAVWFILALMLVANLGLMFGPFGCTAMLALCN